MSDVRTVNYVEPGELEQALRRAREQGRLTEEVARIVERVARRAGAMGAGREFCAADRDEVVSRVFLDLVKRWREIDPERNAFAYVTGMTRYAVAGVARGRRWAARVAKLAQWEEQRRQEQVLCGVAGASVEFGPQAGAKGW